MPTTYHLLTEGEPFSEFKGGAISRWCANVLRDDSEAVVVTPFADESWGFPKNRVIAIAELQTYARFRKGVGRYCPRAIRRVVLGRIFKSFLARLKPGDIVWQHNRPEFASVLERGVHAAGGRLVLHMQNSHLLHWVRTASRMELDHIVFCSNFLKQEAEYNCGSMGNAAVLYNGADQKLFYPPMQLRESKPEPVILLASRLVPDKGIHIFLEAMKLLQRRGVLARARIIGVSGFGGSSDTDYVRRLRTEAPPSVGFEGYCVGAELAEKFREADVFCLPSIWNDPFPLTTLEAMASGLPIVATQSGGIPEAVQGGSGMLVPRGSVDDLANALELLVRNSEMRSAMGQSGYRSFKRNFTWTAVRREYTALLQSLTTCSNLAHSV